jgi:hypothetical protein
MRSTIGLWVLALATAGCSGTEPVELATSYTLSTVEGASPPRLVGATLECDVSIGGGHITFSAAEQFELGLDVLTDCSHGGGTTSQVTYGYTGTAHVDGRQVTFHTATGGGPVTFEGQVAVSGQLQVSVPGLVPTVTEVAVAFSPE